MSKTTNLSALSDVVSTDGTNVTISGNVTQLDGSPEYHFATDSASHYNWRIAAQEQVNGGFEIASGTQTAGSNANSDTYTNRLVIDSAGRVTMPYQPMWTGFDLSGLVSGTSQQKLTFIVAKTNRGNHYNNGTWTCPVAGDYLVSVNLLTRSNAAHNIYLKKNGVDQAFSRDITPSGEQSTGLTAVVACSANDTLEIWVTSDTSGDFYPTYNSMTFRLLS